MSAQGTFLSDIKEIRRRARQHLSEGAVTQNYGGKVEDAVALLNHAVATEIVCILRYKFHAVCATGLASEAVKEEFAQHAKEEEEHLDLLAERINQLGGKPNLNPEGVGSRAASQYAEGENLVDMIKEDLVAERIAIETYRELVRYCGACLPAYGREASGPPTWNRPGTLPDASDDSLPSKVKEPLVFYGVPTRAGDRGRTSDVQRNPPPRSPPR